MNRLISRRAITIHVVVAHAVGLWTAGMVSTIGTTAGFSVAGGGLGLFLGGLLSLPWMMGVAAVVWLYGGWIERHPLVFALTGPVVVCGSWALLAGAFLDAVALSSITSSIFYLLLTALRRVRHSTVEQT
jgi:hypothetical protein